MPIGVAIMALAAMLGSIGLSSVALADASYRDSSVRQSKGQNGSKLKWLPYRPSARTVSMAQQRAEERADRLAEERAEHVRRVELASYESSDTANRADRTDSSHDAMILPPAPPTRVSQTNDGGHEWSLPGSVPDQPAPATETAPRTETPSYNEVTPRPEMAPYSPGSMPMDEANRSLFKHYEDCPAENDFKPINELSDKVVIVDGEYPKECKLPGKDFEPRTWSETLFTWKASGLCHNPLYFEDVQLERYGHSWGPYLQPVLSQGHFFVNVPLLPYHMGLNLPHECIYSLGYYRPGDCAPYMIDPFPLSVRAGVAEAGAVMGGVYLLP